MLGMKNASACTAESTGGLMQFAPAVGNACQIKAYRMRCWYLLRLLQMELRVPYFLFLLQEAAGGLPETPRATHRTSLAVPAASESTDLSSRGDSKHKGRNDV